MAPILYLAELLIVCPCLCSDVVHTGMYLNRVFLAKSSSGGLRYRRENYPSIKELPVKIGLLLGLLDCARFEPLVIAGRFIEITGNGFPKSKEFFEHKEHLRSWLAPDKFGIETL